MELSELFWQAFRYRVRIAQPIAFALIFVIISIAMTWLGIIVSKLSRIALLGWLDRFAGLIFGFCKGLLIASVGLCGSGSISFHRYGTQRGGKQNRTFSHWNSSGYLQYFLWWGRF